MPERRWPGFTEVDVGLPCGRPRRWSVMRGRDQRAVMGRTEELRVAIPGFYILGKMAKDTFILIRPMRTKVLQV